MKKLILLLTITVSGVWGQVGSSPIQFRTSAPTGACPPTQMVYDYVHNIYYGCVSGAWTQVAGTSSGTVTSVALTAPAAFTVSGSPITGAGTIAITYASTSQGFVLIGPASGSGVPTQRALVFTDLPPIASTNLSDSTTLVRNTTANTYITGVQNFSAANITLPEGAGFTASISNTIGIDTTAHNPHIYTGSDTIIATFNGTITNGHCLQGVVTGSLVQVQDAGAACGSGSGGIGGSGTTNFIPFFSASTTLANSVMQQDAGATMLGINGAPDQALTVAAAGSSTTTTVHIINAQAGGTAAIKFKNNSGSDVFTLNSYGTGVGAEGPTLTYTSTLVFAGGGQDTVWLNSSSTDDDFRILAGGGFVVSQNAALTAPISGFGKIWFDSTLHNLETINSSGTISTMIVPNACVGQVVQSVATSGVITCGAGGGGGATNNFSVAGGGTTTLVINPNCTAPSPCNLNIGGTGYVQVGTSGSATTSASGTAVLYLDSTGACFIASTATITGTNCTYVNASNAPIGTYPFAQVGFTTGTWGTPTLYQLATSGAENVTAGTGLTVLSDNGITRQLGIDVSTVSTYSSSNPNFVPQWDSTGHNFVSSIIQGSSTQVSVGGIAPDASYTLQVKTLATGGTTYFGVANTDTTNTGSTGFCMTVNAGAAATCFTQFGSASGGSPGSMLIGGATKYEFGAIFQTDSVTGATCTGTSNGGSFNYIHVNGTTKDTVQVCAQDVSGVWAWRPIY
jgi:hypothetical protein